MKNLYLFVASIIGIIFLRSNEIEAQWIHSGPEGGEVRAFCESGTNLFAAPWSGGIYRSTNNGVSWTEVNNGLTEISITVTALGADGSNVYAGTWGNGVFLSTNFGDSWVEVNNSTTANKHVHAFAVKGTSLFMGSQDGGIVRTTDNGTTWEQMNTGLPSVDVRDIAVLDTIIFVSLWGPNKVYRSTDDGMSWTQASNGITFTLDDPCLNVRGNTIYLGTYLHGVYRSTNNGDEWIEANIGLPASACIRDFAVVDTNIFVGTRDSGVFLSSDNGSSWTPVSSGLTTNRIESMIVNTNQDIFAGTYGKGIFKSTDNGSSWFESSNGFYAIPVYEYVTFPNSSGGEELLAATSGGGVYQSTDNGLEWSYIGLSGEWVTGLAVLDSNIFASTMGHGVFRSTDGGANWTASGLANAMLQTIYSSGTELYAGAAFFGGASRSTDYGNTWSSIASLAYKWVYTFTSNENFVFAGAYFGGAFRSSDHGISFTPINTGLDSRVTILTVMDSSIFAGTGDANGVSAAGVFRSDNNGDSWTQTNNGLPSTLMVWSLAVMGDNIFASSSTSGQNKVAEVYLSTDRGANWSSASTGLMSNYILTLFINETNIFAGTIGSSTWWRPLDEMIPDLLPLNPSNLIVVADTFSVTLNWQDNSDNENGFVIERKDGDSLSAAQFEAIDTVNTNINEYVDTGLEADYTYTYRVYAYNEFGTSAYSNLAQVTTLVPVELTSFTAMLGENDVTLNWTTATELNNQGFEIERSKKSEVRSQNWEKIGYVPGYGTTTEPKTYAYIDENVSTGEYFYRLKQIDYDGTFSYSEEITVEVDLTPKEYTLEQNYPNPFNPTTKIIYSIAFAGNVQLIVYNGLGEEISLLVNETQQPGRYTVEFNASSLSSGIYFYKLIAGDFVSIRKMIFMK